MVQLVHVQFRGRGDGGRRARPCFFAIAFLALMWWTPRATAHIAQLPTYLAVLDDASAAASTRDTTLHDRLAHALPDASTIASTWRTDLWEASPSSIGSSDIRALHAAVSDAWMNGHFDEALTRSASVSSRVCSTRFGDLRRAHDGPSWTALALLRISVLLVEERLDDADAEARCLAHHWQTRDQGLSALYPEATERVLAHRHQLSSWDTAQWRRDREDVLRAFGGRWIVARVSIHRGQTRLELREYLGRHHDRLLCDLPPSSWSTVAFRDCLQSPQTASRTPSSRARTSGYRSPTPIVVVASAGVAAGITASLFQASAQRDLAHCSAGSLNPCRATPEVADLRDRLQRRQTAAITTWSLALTALATTAAVNRLRSPVRARTDARMSLRDDPASGPIFQRTVGATTSPSSDEDDGLRDLVHPALTALPPQERRPQAERFQSVLKGRVGFGLEQ